MQRYGVRAVERMLGLPRSTIRSLVQAGFVTPARGARGVLLFSFQDLIVLRAAWGLARAELPTRRIIRSLKQLRAQLPQHVPLSGLRIGAVGDEVVVHEGDVRWQAGSGQYLLALEVDVDIAGGMLRIADPRDEAHENAENWFSRGAVLEALDAEAAQEAYQQALAADPAHAGAATNLGRMLHEDGELAEAERIYRAGLAACGSDALLHYNLGVLLEDSGRDGEAVVEYAAALADDPSLADCHYNLARLHQSLGHPRLALRHLAQYRKLGGEAG